MFTQEKINLLYALAAVLAQSKDNSTIEETNKKIREVVESIKIKE